MQSHPYLTRQGLQFHGTREREIGINQQTYRSGVTVWMYCVFKYCYKSDSKHQHHHIQHTTYLQPRAGKLYGAPVMLPMSVWPDPDTFGIILLNIYKSSTTFTLVVLKLFISFYVIYCGVFEKAHMFTSTV